MNTETVIISVVLALLAAVVGYLLAHSKAKKAQVEKNETLIATRAELSQLQQQGAEQRQQLESTTQQQRSQELELKQAQTQLESAEQRKAELAEELQGANNKAEAQTRLARDAEKTTEAAKAELKETREQQAGLNTRLAESAESVASLRTQLDQQKTLTADQVEKAKGFEVKAEENGKSSVDLKKRLNELEAKFDNLQDKYTSISTEYSELKAQAEERDAGHVKQLKQFEEQKNQLTKEFENLAGKIFEEKGRAFSTASQQNLNQLLKPFSEQVESFQKRVNEVHGVSLQNSSKLQAEIQKVVDMGIKMSDDANNLTSALKGDKKALGNWGELQVEKLLQMSGLEEGREYQREANFKSEDGRDQRPDFIINLPNDKHLIVDSKMSLTAHVLAVQAESEGERIEHLRNHGAAIRKHIRDLSKKNYPKLKGVKSPEFVFMFIASEAAYLAALEAEPNLISGAYDRGIAIVTPNTMLASLRIVSHLWSIDKQNGNTLELANQASKVYDKLRVFAEKMDKLGVQINTVQKTYDDSWNTLTAGKGSLTKQVSKFVDMGVTVKERLAATLTEDNGIDSLMTSSPESAVEQVQQEIEAISEFVPAPMLTPQEMPMPTPPRFNQTHPELD